MLEPTATAARSVADNRPAITASMVPLPTTARFAMNSGHASFSRARDDVSGARGAGESAMGSAPCSPVQGRRTQMRKTSSYRARRVVSYASCHSPIGGASSSCER